MAAVHQRPPARQCRAPILVPGPGAAQPRAVMASRQNQKVSSAGGASLDPCYHGLPRKLPAGGASLGMRVGTSQRTCAWICSQFPCGCRSLAPSPASRTTRRFVTARAIPLWREADIARGVPSQPTRQDVTARLVGWRPANGLPPATMAIAAEHRRAACSKRHVIRREHDGRGSSLARDESRRPAARICWRRHLSSQGKAAYTPTCTPSCTVQNVASK
jgi:hypothetical protein